MNTDSNIGAEFEAAILKLKEKAEVELDDLIVVFS